MKMNLARWLIPVVLIPVLSVPALSAEHHHGSRSKTRAHTETAKEEVDPPPAIEQPLGLGLMLGDLTGISGKYWVSEANSYDGGFSYQMGDFAALHADYLWNISQLFGMSGRQKRSDSRTSPYFGIGAITYFDTSKGTADPNADTLFHRLKSSGLALGARVPMGIEYQPAIVPCGIFGEFAPGAVLIPGMIGMLQAEAGVRFYI